MIEIENNKINKMIEEIKEKNKIEPNDLFLSLVSERLNKDLSNYNGEVLNSFNLYYYRVDPIKFIKGLLK